MRNYDPQVARMVEMTGFVSMPPVLSRIPGVIAPVFVVGSPRSGTTVLGKCLASHPVLAGADESLFLLHLWELFAQRHQGQFRKGWAPMSGYLPAEDLLDEIGQFSDRVFSTLSRRLRKPRIVDHTPIYGLLAPFINVIYPDAIYIHIIRDGRAVVSSLANSAAQGFKWADSDTGSLGAMWADIVTMTRERCGSLGASRYVEVRYEDLCGEPDPVLRGLCERLGLDWSDSILAPLSQSHARPAREHFTLASAHDGQITVTPRIAPTNLEAEWSEESRQGFVGTAGALMSELGYFLADRGIKAEEGSTT